MMVVQQATNQTSSKVTLWLQPLSEHPEFYCDYATVLVDAEIDFKPKFKSLTALYTGVENLLTECAKHLPANCPAYMREPSLISIEKFYHNLKGLFTFILLYDPIVHKFLMSFSEQIIKKLNTDTPIGTAYLGDDQIENEC